ncbi:hypothetical protein GOODEAATRI_013373, partial [Goodea atripinnis]
GLSCGYLDRHLGWILHQKISRTVVQLKHGCATDHQVQFPELGKRLKENADVVKLLSRFDCQSDRYPCCLLRY